jgi:hypothetical protein
MPLLVTKKREDTNPQLACDAVDEGNVLLVVCCVLGLLFAMHRVGFLLMMMTQQQQRGSCFEHRERDQ